MRRIGLWQSQPLRPHQLQFTQAFAADTTSFAEWLQFIFLPRRTGGSGGGSVSFPKRRGDTGDPEAGDLLRLLAEFDALPD
jgi:hypothetical protein